MNVHWLIPFIHSFVCASIHPFIYKSCSEWLLCSRHGYLFTGATVVLSASEWRFQWKGHMSSQLQWAQCQSLSTRHYEISKWLFLCLNNKTKMFTASFSFTSLETLAFFPLCDNGHSNRTGGIGLHRAFSFHFSDDWFMLDISKYLSVICISSFRKFPFVYSAHCLLICF